jgi:hypothetical protein
VCQAINTLSPLRRRTVRSEILFGVAVVNLRFLLTEYSFKKEEHARKNAAVKRSDLI